MNAPLPAPATALTGRRLPAIAQNDPAAISAAIADDGCAFIPGVLSPDLSAETCRQIDALSHLDGDGRNHDGKSIDHYKCVFNRDPFWLRFLDQPGIIDAVERLLGSNCHIIGMSAWRSPPGVRRQGIHADQIFLPISEDLLLSGQVVLPVFIMTLHFYLCDIDESLCPTWVIPGSHKAGRGPRPADPGQRAERQRQLTIANSQGGEEETWRGQTAFPVVCNAGDCMLFRSEIWHHGSANTSDRTRYLLQVHYAQRVIAQRFPPYIEFRHNPVVMAEANERQQRMMGKHTIGAYG